MNNSQYLLLWFEAPLQSWGYDSKFGRRETLDFPTFSGVMGLLCCALGRGGKQNEFLADFVDMDMHVIAYTRITRKGDQTEAKSTREPRLRDFHTVGNGYDADDSWQKLLIPKTSDGKKAVGGGSKLTYRYYLQDMAFAVALEVSSVHVDPIVQALKRPVWDLYLGRKCCVPTEMIFQGTFSDVNFANIEAEKIAKSKELAEDFRVLRGERAGEVLTLNDIPVQFGQNKQYSDRIVTVIKAG